MSDFDFLSSDLQKRMKEIKEANTLTSEQLEKCKEFFGEFFDEERYNDKGFAIWQLSTAIFDCYGHSDMSETLEKMKTMFPELYVEVLEEFLKGNHDT